VEVAVGRSARSAHRVHIPQCNRAAVVADDDLVRSIEEGERFDAGFGGGYRRTRFSRREVPHLERAVVVA
jgi:hypothetical protein